MLTAAIPMLSIAMLSSASALSGAALATEPQLLESNLNRSAIGSNSGSSLGYNVFSSDQKELRWCTGLDRSTRSLPLMYSYLVQSNEEIHFDELEKALTDAVARQVLDCTSSPTSDADEAVTSRIVGLEVSVSTYGGGVSENFCNSGVYCHVVGSKMIVALEGDRRKDSQQLARVHDVIENSLESISVGGMKASYISERPSLTRSEILRVSAPSGMNEKTSGFSVFTATLVVVFSVGSILAIVTLHYSSRHKDDELDVPTSITVALSIEDDPPTERCKDILPVNLDVEHFVFADKTQDLHWMRTDFRASTRGFCIELDTVAEEEELSDIEEGSI